MEYERNPLEDGHPREDTSIESGSPAYRGTYSVVPADEGAWTALSPSPSSPGQPEHRPVRRAGGWAKTACVALACLLLGAGGAGAYFFHAGGGSDVPPALEEPESADTQALAAADPSDAGGDMSAADIYSMACEQVAGITVQLGQTLDGQAQTATGSGFILTEDGYIVTNYHVVSGAVSGGIQVTLHSGEVCQAEYVGGDEESDVALLKIEAGGLHAVTLGESDRMAVGEPVYVVGNPLGVLDYTLTSGLVSALDREIEVSADGYTYHTVNMFQIDAAVNAGNSGGPVYNARGEVIGMVTAKSGDTGTEGLGFAIPIGDVAEILEDLRDYGYVRGRAYMGIVNPQDVGAEIVEAYGLPAGVYVTALAEGGPAAEAGLLEKDIITGLDDTEISSYSDLKNALRDYRAGDTATVRVYRSGQSLELVITFGEKNASQVGGQAESDTGYSMDTGEGYSSPDTVIPFEDGGLEYYK